MVGRVKCDESPLEIALLIVQDVEIYVWSLHRAKEKVLCMCFPASKLHEELDVVFILVHIDIFLVLLPVVCRW